MDRCLPESLAIQAYTFYNESRVRLWPTEAKNTSQHVYRLISMMFGSGRDELYVGLLATNVCLRRRGLEKATSLEVKYVAYSNVCSIFLVLGLLVEWCSDKVHGKSLPLPFNHNLPNLTLTRIMKNPYMHHRLCAGRYLPTTSMRCERG